MLIQLKRLVTFKYNQICSFHLHNRKQVTTTYTNIEFTYVDRLIRHIFNGNIRYFHKEPTVTFPKMLTEH